MNKGVDADGYIVNPCTGIQESYAPLVQDVCNSIKSTLGERLHSLYLYGSVSRGVAIQGKSDLDMVVLFQTKPSDEEKSVLNDIERSINSHSITPVGFDVGDIEEVQESGQELFWQFFLKHGCYCLYGQDLSSEFPRVKPSMQLAISLNKGLSAKLYGLLQEITLENHHDNSKSISIAKQLIRSAYFLVMEQDCSFYNNIDDCARAFLAHVPEKKSDIEFLLSIAEGKEVSLSQLQEIVEGFGGWIFKSILT